MSHCRIFLNQPLEPGYDATIPADQAHYLRHVMRLVSGDPITLFNGHGGEYQATVVGLSKQGSSCHVEEFINVERELPVHIHIIQCANKSDKIETVLQKCTELGAASFQIASSERSQFKLTEKKLGSRLERWQKIITEATEQSERTTIPPVVWKASLKSLQVTENAYTLHPEATTQWREEREHISTATDITLAIGPEGGWSRNDLETLSELGFTSLVFGPRVMRTETAAPALLAAIQAVRKY
ncbi:MAG: 16S rRNA (uracil(1498)-N(3))-methyltransferase [Mariprofundaceae bacterium]